MDPLVIVDTNIVLAACFGPALDTRAEVARQVFQDLEDLRVKPHVMKSIKEEAERKRRDRVGQILDALRRISQEAMSAQPSGDESEFDMLEDLLARLRSEAPESVNALLLLERQVAKTIRESTAPGQAQKARVITQVAMETSVLLSEIQRRLDALGVEVLQDPPEIVLDRFRNMVQGTDVEHVARASALAEAKKCVVIFVTMDGRLHAARDKIAVKTPNLVVTMPTYLRRQIERTRKSV